MFRKNQFALVVMLFAVLFSGCLFGGAKVYNLEICPESLLVQQGKSVNLSVVAFDNKDNEVEPTKPEWVLVDETKGVLEADGASAVFTANGDAEGTVKIEVTSDTKTASIKLTITSDDLSSRILLKGVIDEAKELVENNEPGSNPGQVKADSYGLLEDAIEAGEAVYEDLEATGAQIDDVYGALQDAIVAFNDAFIHGDFYLDRTNWTARASNNGAYTGNALNDDKNDSWHGSKQEPGKWFELDMQSDQAFNLITLWNEKAPADLPRGFDVYLAADGDSPEYGEPIYEGGFPQDNEGGIGDILFDEIQTARWAKIVLTEEDPQGKYFAIYEIYAGTRY